MKRLIIPVGAAALALAATVSLALGPNSRAEWRVDGAAGGVLAVQRAPVVAGDPTTTGTARPDAVPETRAATAALEPTAGAEHTPEPGRTPTSEASKEPRTTRTPIAVGPTSTPAALATPALNVTPLPTEPVNEEPAATKAVEPRVGKGEPAHPVELADAAIGANAMEPSKDDDVATSANANKAERTGRRR